MQLVPLPPESIFFKMLSLGLGEEEKGLGSGRAGSAEGEGRRPGNLGRGDLQHPGHQQVLIVLAFLASLTCSVCGHSMCILKCKFRIENL